MKQQASLGVVDCHLTSLTVECLNSAYKYYDYKYYIVMLSVIHMHRHRVHAAYLPAQSSHIFLATFPTSRSKQISTKSR